MGIFDRLKTKSPTSSEPSAAGSAPGAEEATPAPEIPKAAPTNEQDRSTPDGMFSRFRQGLQKTTRLLNTDIRDLFKAEGQLVDDDFLDRVFAILVRTDMGTAPAGAIKVELQNEFKGRVVQMSDLLECVKLKLLDLTEQEEKPIQLQDQGPTIILVVGVNGSGKTTSIAKLTKHFRDQGRTVTLGAGDTFRAAAVEQLTVWAERLGAEIVKGKHGADPASVVHRTVATALETNADVCIIDTAGRLQTQSNLMDQLVKIRRVITKQIEDAPHEVILVLDATAGQNAISQAKGFSDAAGCTGIMLAKLDGTAKGGVVIPIREQFDIPVKYIGVGEQAEDLALFNPRDFVDAMFADAS